jgi:acetolactate synthase regulatory subunit
MQTAKQCRADAAEYQVLAKKANISIRRATLLMNISRSWKSLANQLDRLSDLNKVEAK